MDFSSIGTTEWLVIAGVVLLLVILLVVVLAMRRRRRTTLTERYGPEYERTVKAAGGERAARHDLADRERERGDLRLRDLDDRQRREFGQRMARLQYRFAEDPAGAVYESGRVAADALRARGYPITEDRDRALGLLALDHPKEAQPLRAAIDGSYGKDQGRLRETFIGVRDSLREVVGVHYVLEDGTAARSGTTSPSSGTGRSSSASSAAPAAATGAAAAALASGSGDRDDERDTGTRERDAGTSERDAGTSRDAERHTGGGAHREDAAAPGDTDDDERTDPDQRADDRTVRLDEAEADTPSRPVGTVPPEPGRRETP